jgi:hypothetical protein
MKNTFMDEPNVWFESSRIILFFYNFLWMKMKMDTDMNIKLCNSIKFN